MLKYGHAVNPRGGLLPWPATLNAARTARNDRRANGLPCLVASTASSATKPPGRGVAISRQRSTGGGSPL